MNQAEVEIDEVDEAGRGIPAPEECARRPSVAGTPVLMGDGRAWPLAAYVPSLGAVWDRLYDDGQLKGAYSLEDIQLAASRLLLENFDLRPEAVAILVSGAEASALVVAIETAMYGPPGVHRTWSDWVLGSLYANGIDPASVPPDRLQSVLDMLVATRRAVPQGKYISSAEAAPQLGAMRAAAQAEAARRAASNPAAPPAPPDATP